MKKISFFLMMLVAVLLASCSKQQGAKLIPEDAMVVMRFDVTQTMEKSGLSGDKSELKDWMKEQVEDMGLDKKMRERVLNIIDDPTKSGIDFTEPVYCYLTMGKRDAEGGLVGNMADKGDLTDLLNSMAELAGEDVVEEANGVNYVSFDSKTAFIFTGDWFFVGTFEGDVDDMIATLKERADGKGSIEGNKAFDVMANKKGVMQVLLTGSGIESMFKMQGMGEDINDFMPDGLEIEDIASVMDLEFNNGETLFSTQSVPLSEGWKEYIDKNIEMLKDIDKSQAKYISDNALSLFINIDTKKVSSFVEKLVEDQLDDEDGMDEIKEVLDAIKMFDGTAEVDIYGFNNDGPLVSAYVGAKDERVMELLGQLLESEDTVCVVGENQFMIPSSYDYDWNEDTYEYTRTPKTWNSLGYKDGKVYFTFDEDHIFTIPDKKYPASDIKGKGIYLRFNFDFLKNLLSEMDGEEKEAVKAIVKIFDYAELYCEGDTGVFRIVNRAKDKTLIEAIGDYVKKLL